MKMLLSQNRQWSGSGNVMKKHFVAALLCAFCVFSSGMFIYTTAKLTDLIEKQTITIADLSNRINQIENITCEFEGTFGQGSEEVNDILSFYEVSKYLKIQDSLFRDLINRGEFEGTYIKLDAETYIFIREKLYDWCIAQIDDVER